MNRDSDASVTDDMLASLMTLVLLASNVTNANNVTNLIVLASLA